ncbi:hypothetical protein EDB83DRAFT_2580947 [Lactarius deliciosus]|nr:hypothetical protein EDB83DRAFT_2580947 [Lactarius deliciosus]
MDFPKSIYWHGVLPFARAASPQLHFASFTTPSPSLSPFRTHALMCLPFCSCAAPPPRLHSAPHCPHTLRATPPLAARTWVASSSFRGPPSRAACNPGGLGTRGGGWAERTDPLASLGVSRHGGGRKRRAGVARAEEDWAGGAHGVGLAWPAQRGGRTVTPLANAGRARGAGLCAPSLLLRAWAGQGWTHCPSSCIRGQGGARGVGLVWPVRRGGRTVPPLAYAGRAGRGAWGWAGIACAEGDWGGHTVLRAPAGRGRDDVPSCAPFPPEWGRCWEGRGQGAASPRDRGGPDMGEGPARPLSACEGTAAVNVGDRVGERLKTVRDAGRGGVLVLGRRDVMGMGPVLDPVAEASCACHVSYWVHSFPLAHPFADARGQADTPPLPLHCAPPFVCRKRCTMGRAGPSPVSGPPRSRGLATPWPLPSQHLPHSGGKGAHEGTSSRPLPAGARRTACPPQSPSVQAMPAQPHAPRPALPAYARGGTPNPTRPALPAYARGRTVRPSPPRPRTQEEGRRAQPSPTRPPAFARGVTVRPPLCAGHTSPTPRAPPCPRTQEDGRRVQPRPAHARKGRDGAHSPVLLGVGDTSPAFTPPATPAHPRGCKRVRAASGGVARRVCGQCGAERNPGGGAAHEQKGRHIGAWVRKGESDGEGVVNEAKRSRGEAARANGGTPCQ